MGKMSRESVSFQILGMIIPSCIASVGISSFLLVYPFHLLTVILYFELIITRGVCFCVCFLMGHLLSSLGNLNKSFTGNS